MTTTRRTVPVSPRPSGFRPGTLGFATGVIVGCLLSSLCFFSLVFSVGHMRECLYFPEDFLSSANDTETPLSAIINASPEESLAPAKAAETFPCECGNATPGMDTPVPPDSSATSLAADTPLPDVVQTSPPGLEYIMAQLVPGQLERFDRSAPLVLDIGLNDGADTKYHLEKGRSVIAVDAFPKWVEDAKSELASYIEAGKLLALNAGLVLEGAGGVMPLYFKKPGSITASFDIKKGCSGAKKMEPPDCLHQDVYTARCDTVVNLAGKAPWLMKIDIEMLHHVCVRSLRFVAPELLPEYLCWEEHDKPFGKGGPPPLLTDAKLLLGLWELGYDEVKLILSGTSSARYYGVDPTKASKGTASGDTDPEEQMDYRTRNANGTFSTDWLPLSTNFDIGLRRRDSFYHGLPNVYFDICVKKIQVSRTAMANVIKKRQSEENFPLHTWGVHKIVQEG